MLVELAFDTPEGPRTISAGDGAAVPARVTGTVGSVYMGHSDILFRKVACCPWLGAEIDDAKLPKGGSLNGRQPLDSSYT